MTKPIRRLVVALVLAGATVSVSAQPVIRAIISTTVALLPGTPSAGDVRLVTDGASASDCTTGGGSTAVWCYYTGSAWVAFGDGGGGGGSQNLFETFDAPAGTDPVADSTTDTLTLAATAPVTITGDASTDTVTFALTQGAGTDVTADLEEETHAPEHSFGGADAVTITEAQVSDLQPYLLNVVEDSTPQLGGELDASGNSVIGLADVTFRSGAAGGTVRTGTSAADLFKLQAWDTNGGTYRDMLELDAGAIPLMSLFHVTEIDIDDGGAIRTGLLAGETALLQARDVDGASWTTFATLTANNTPTFNLASSTTIGGALACLANASNCPALSAFSGAVTDAQVPDTITINLAATATALAANGANCSAGNYPLGVDASGAAEGCTADDTGTDDQTAAEVPYAPTTGTDWVDPDPTEAGGALDDLAGRLTIEEAKADDDVPEAADYTNLTGGPGIVNSPTGTIATASQESGFLADGDAVSLTCGAGTAGQAQVMDDGTFEVCDGAATPGLRFFSPGAHTTDTTCSDAGVNCLFAGSATEGGSATSAVQLDDADYGDVSSSSGTLTVEGLQYGAAFPVSPATGDVFAVTDDSATGACDSAAGSALSLCRWNGSAWVALGDGSGGGTPGGSSGEIQYNNAGAFAGITGTNTSGGAILLANTPFLTPALSGANDTSFNTGISIGRANDLIEIIVGGARVWMIDSTGHFMPNNIAQAAFLRKSGGYTAATPAYGFNLDQNTGLRAGTSGDSGSFYGVSDGVDVLGQTATATTLYVAQVNAPSAQTCAEDGTGAAGALTLTVSGVSYVALTNADSAGCVVTLSETGATNGQRLEIVVVSNAGGTVDFSDTAGVSETAGTFSMAAWDAIVFRYSVDRWVEVSRSNN